MFPAEIFQQTVTKIVAILAQHGIRFHLTGGMTGAAYGEPRMTQDVDLVLDPVQTAGELNGLLASLAISDFLFDEQSIRNAVSAGGMFQLLDRIETLKLDLYPRELIAGELDRSVSLEVFEGMELPVVCRVDAAASKLVWIDKGSHKSRRDLRAIHRNANPPEQNQIAHMANGLGLEALLSEVLEEADELE